MIFISRVVSLIIQKNTFVKIKFVRFICELRQYFPRKRSFFRFAFFFFWGGDDCPLPANSCAYVWEQSCASFFYYYNFERNYDVLKSKSPCFYWKKTKQNRKWKIPRRFFERWTLCVSSYKNRKLKVELWWAGAHKRKKSALFVTFFCSKKIFFNICVLLQCLMFWTNFQNIYTFEYQKSFPELF